ncbi:MAG: hypothetical protein HY301_18975, partial [Verrucomicrobia bacterium]|nr:hypothetical protein [Verrucomicrobiota bacterium]
FITGCYIHAPRSIFSGIVKVPAAGLLEFDLKAPGGRLVAEARYWKIAPPAQRDEARSADDWKAELAHLLDDAVRIRLLSDVPLGAFLSGGLDSATVCALASAHVREPLRAFTIGSDDPAHDETADAAAVAGILGLRHVTEKCRLDPTTLLPEMATVFDEPFSDLSMIPTHQVARLAAREVKVVLTGDGADEFFAGYGIFQSMTGRGRLEQIPGLDHVARAVGHRLPIGAPGGGFLARHFRGRGLARYRCQVEEPALLRLLAPGLAPDAAALWPELAELWETSANFDALGRVSFLQGSTYLSDDILVKVDRATMAHSLEARSPFLDYRVVELALRLPARLKLADGTGKKILRDLARRWFSAAHLAKPKRGFTVPLKQWMDGALADDLDDLKNCDLLARAPVVRLVAMQRRGRRDYSSLLWRLIILNRWSRQWRTPPCKS